MEIIYEKLGLWERIKNRGKKILKNLPMNLLGFMKRAVMFLLGFMGWEMSPSSMLWRFIPTKSIVQWILTGLSLYFPILLPFVPLAKMV